MRLTVPRRGGWRAWGVVRADFEHALAAPADPANTSAEIASELRRGADYVRVTIAITVLSTDVADALAIAWDAFRSAARDDLTGWQVAAAGAEVQPEPHLIRAGCHTARCSPPSVRGQAARACGTRSPSSCILLARAIMAPRSWSVTAIASWARVPAMSSSAQAVLADVDNVVQPLGLLAGDAVVEADQQAVQPSGQVLEVRRVHVLSLRVGRGDPGQRGRVRRPGPGGQPGGDLPGLLAGDWVMSKSQLPRWSSMSIAVCRQLSRRVSICPRSGNG